ncbi:SDR family NAD(P)-dependent oxidoreductase [Paraburkholderia sediminicola]|uniref:SDR family NAD(P)-dependent oxidoreductase n=1 Tax=Paraburkholderia sediminicola TaxID=458836 RepID=UPI000F11BCEE
MTPPIRFDGGTAVITGAASGIGSGLARHAASLGMRLVLADVERPRLDAFAATLDADVLTVNARPLPGDAGYSVVEFPLRSSSCTLCDCSRCFSHAPALPSTRVFDQIRSTPTSQSVCG